MGRLSSRFSLSLDLARVLAACTVVLCHFGARRMSGGLLWFLNPYGAQAVDVFFVLSGYLISHAAQREPSPARFAASRAARIYSVALPACGLTFALDAAGRWFAPDLYAALPAYAAGHAGLALQAGAGLAFFNRAWFLTIPVFSNVPWWSLGYEVAYYAAFGLAWYGGRAVRVVGPLMVAVAAGPNIVALAPLWVAGVAVHRWHVAGGPGDRLVRPLALLPPMVWLGYETVAHIYGRPFNIIPMLRSETLQDLLMGGLFAAFLCALPRLVSERPAPPRLAGIIRFLAGRSFALYLLHYPVMLCLHAAMLRFAPGTSPFWLLPLVLGIVLLLAELTERRKPLLLAAFGRLSI